MSRPPEIIYLQWIGEDGVKIDINETQFDVTWCKDKINNNDIKYIRHNKYAQLRTHIKELEAENEQLKKIHCIDVDRTADQISKALEGK